MFLSLTYLDILSLNSVKQIEGHRWESYVNVFNKLWEEMAWVDSFSSHILVRSQFSVENRFGLYISFSLWDISFPSSFLSIVFHQPVGTVGSAAVVAHVPDCFLGQTSRSRVKKPGKKTEGKICWRGRERRRERILQHYGASSIIQMATVPLHLFSLLDLNIKMVAPKEADIQRMKPTQRAKAEGAWLPRIPATAVNERETICATDGRTLKRGSIPVTFGLNSIRDRLRDCITNIE